MLFVFYCPKRFFFFRKFFFLLLLYDSHARPHTKNPCTIYRLHDEARAYKNRFSLHFMRSKRPQRILHTTQAISPWESSSRQQQQTIGCCHCMCIFFARLFYYWSYSKRFKRKSTFVVKIFGQTTAEYTARFIPGTRRGDEIRSRPTPINQPRRRCNIVVHCCDVSAQYTVRRCRKIGRPSVVDRAKRAVRHHHINVDAALLLAGYTVITAVTKLYVTRW